MTYGVFVWGGAPILEPGDSGYARPKPAARLRQSLVVDFSTDSQHAPCMVMVTLRNRREQERVHRHLVAYDAGCDDCRSAALLSWDDVESMLSARQYRDLSAGWTVGVRMDRWEAFSLFGYDAGDTLA